MLTLVLLSVGFALGWLVGVWVTSYHDRHNVSNLLAELQEYKDVTEALKLEVQLIHDALRESERVTVAQNDVLRFQAQTIEDARASAERFNVALDEALKDARPWERQLGFVE